MIKIANKGNYINNSLIDITKNIMKTVQIEKKYNIYILINVYYYKLFILHY